MLFNQTNQFKKQEFQTVKKKEQTDSMVSHFCTLLHKEVQPMAQKERATVNRNYKDTVFRMLFSDRRNLLSLYNAISGAHYDDPEKLEIVTLENAIYMGMKNDLAFIIDTELFLYEHQSTYNPNMPLRDLFYISSEYQKLVDKKSLYSSVLQKIPAPQFIVFYNGTDKAEVIAMSIFEYDKEEEERKLRKAEYEAGVESGIAEGKRLAQKEGTIALSRLGLPVEQIAMALQVDVELAKQWIGDK